MANTINHTESLKDYLNVQLDETYDLIRETESRLHTNTTAVTAEYNKLLFRKVWLQTQLDNIYFRDAIAELPENPNNFDETFSHLLNK